MFRPVVYAAALGVAAAARGAIINVGPGASIQSAINTAADGDTIIVAPGTYAQKVDFLGKAVTLRSSGGAAVTVIDASGLLSSVITCRTNEGSDTVLDGFTIRGGQGNTWLSKRVGGGMFNSWAEPTVRNCVFTQNSADEGAGMWNRGRDPSIQDCVFAGNTATTLTGLGGGGMFNELSDPTLINCAFSGNSTTNYGGGMYSNVSNLTLINCAFYGNTGDAGAGIYAADSSVTLVNCTVGGNAAAFWGGGAALLSCDTTISNSIFWDNGPEEILAAGGTAAVHHSNIMGGWSGLGSDNIDDEPLFVDPANGDYHLAPGSPCIEQGDDSAVPPAVEADLDGNPRFVGTVDMGPYELQGAGTCDLDLNGDGDVNVTDLLDLLAQWGTNPGGPPDFDGDSQVNVSDLLALLGDMGPCP